MEEYVVKTSLHVQPFAKHALEALVLKRSKIESHANLVYTLMLLRRYESGLPFTKMFVSQSAVWACLRSVCSRKKGVQPSPVEFKDLEVQAAIRNAQDTVLPTITSFEDNTGLTQTMNQSARSFLTVFQNNVFMRLEAWQLRALRAEFRRPGSPMADSSKQLISFLTRASAREINSAKELDASQYKDEEIQQFDLATCVFYQGVVSRHKTALQ